MFPPASCPEPVDVSKYGIIYGGVQKNIDQAGMVIVIIREDLITEDVLPGTPTMLTYKTHAGRRFSLQHAKRILHLCVRQGVQMAEIHGRT